MYLMPLNLHLKIVKVVYVIYIFTTIKKLTIKSVKFETTGEIKIMFFCPFHHYFALAAVTQVLQSPACLSYLMVSDRIPTQFPPPF